MTPHKDLTDRIKALGPDIAPYQVMAEAQVIYQNYYNWQKGESPYVQRWYAMLSGSGINPLSMEPDWSTYVVLKKKLLTRTAAIEAFQKYGFARITALDWSRKGDPRQIEAFKRVNHVVTKYEHHLQKLLTVS
ncbi:MAG TPA: hypothetical protein VN038_01300 [Dyadobacter sp.]|nr:hypothetical protein [Dyadobacter sp.]